ncbi:MAG: ABC transporter permease [Clostridia bacterium]|nr:ABC transporter permease [Clostridia bacterium]NLF20857.1 ABC transporter permease [Clostridiaceae bacterium]
MEFLKNNWLDLLEKVGEHFFIAMAALLAGVLVAVPIGILLTRTPRLAKITVSVASVLQTIPSLALLAIMVPLFGVGKVPAIIALFIYSLLPILRNTFSGMDSVDKGVLDAAKGMGLKSAEIIRRVQLPLASPVIMAGIRLSGVYVVAWATLASYIGAGGLGDYIFTGLNNFNQDFIIWGTVPVTLLALLTDAILRSLEKKVRPRTHSSRKELA